MSPSSSLRALGLLAVFTLGACTAILVPDVEDDGVARCEITADCPETGDTRYVPACVLWEDKDPAAQKICSADFRDVPCGSNVYGASHPLTLAFLAARSNKASYQACAPEQLDSLGCGPNEEGACDEGLELNVYETCYDPDALLPAVGIGQVEDFDEIVGRDVQDQFCRSFFCDASFVCSNRGQRPICVPCRYDRYLGSGGCGVLHVEGEPAWPYLDVEAGNCAGELESEDIDYGEPPPQLAP